MKKVKQTNKSVKQVEDTPFDTCADHILEQLGEEWAEASAVGDLKLAKQKLEFMINYLSSPTLLIKLAPDLEEVEAIELNVRQLAGWKEELRKINQQTLLAA